MYQVEKIIQRGATAVIVDISKDRNARENVSILANEKVWCYHKVVLDCIVSPEYNYNCRRIEKLKSLN